MKRCKKCGLVKPLDDFYRNKLGREGRRPECKACAGTARRAWYAANKSDEIQRVKAWQRATPSG